MRLVTNQVWLLCSTSYYKSPVTVFDDRYEEALKYIDFELVVLSHSTVDGLSVALCCTSIAAPVPELRSLKVRKYARCNYEKTARNPSVFISVNMATA